MGEPSHDGLALTLLRSLLGHRRQCGAPLRRPGNQLGAGALGWVHLRSYHAFYAAWAFTQQGRAPDLEQLLPLHRQGPASA